MDDGEAILAEARHGLREEDDLTVLNARDRQLGVPRALLCHVAARGRAVLLLELGQLLGAEVGLHPLIQLGALDPSGVAVLEVVGHHAARDILDDGALTHQLLGEGLLGLGKPREVVAHGLQVTQEAIERGDDLQPLRGEGLLPGTLEVIDR